MTALATTTLEMVSRERWDAIVIGAGPAGALAARGLAQRQVRTLLVDRKAFPRDKVCGSCISRPALSLLEQAGLAARIEPLEGIPLTEARIVIKSRSLRVPLPGVMFIPRSALDEALVKAAIAEGVRFLPEVTAAVSPPSSSDKTLTRVVELKDSKGGSVTALASAVVAADGLGHPSLRNCPEFRDQVVRNSRMGLGATFSTTSSGFDLGSVTMAVARSGYVGAVRLRDGRLHLAASVDCGAMRRAHQPPHLIARILKESHLPRVPELADADWQGTIPLTRRSSQVACQRIFLIGDAAGYVEPFTGEGIAWALTTGMAVPTFVKQALHETSGQAELDWQSCYQQLIHHRQDWCRWLAWLLRKPPLASAALWLLSLFPRVPQFVVNRLNRHLSLAERDFA